ncbi:hypothetical protein FOZ63_015320 [Perkinsus olseni]|uniref:Uncharacterized protein n=1 Tax=Perkinsus olseni TaxID=32597 RepID=A0A7J6UJN3_PEROL|nr:hypothetical protein FOZ63_015320 [Perkinsus olseni]
MGFVIAENSYEVNAIIAINNMGGGAIDVKGVPIVVAPFVKEHAGLIESSPVSSTVSRTGTSTGVGSSCEHYTDACLGGIGFDFDEYVREALDLP